MLTLSRCASFSYSGPQTLVSKSDCVTTRPAWRARYATMRYSVAVRFMGRSLTLASRSHIELPQSQEPRVVVGHDHRFLLGAHRSTLSHTGSENVKLLPAPGSLSTQMRPPWASTSPRQMASPSPVPLTRRARSPS